MSAASPRRSWPRTTRPASQSQLTRRQTSWRAGIETEGARVVVEAGGVVQARRLDHLVEVAAHAVEAVVEPPGRAEPQRRVVAGQRGQLAGVGRLVQGEQDQRQPRVVAEGVEQRLQVARELGGSRDVGALVAAEALEQQPVVVADEPTCSCITSPSSTLMRAISISMWPVKRRGVLGGRLARAGRARRWPRPRPSASRAGVRRLRARGRWPSRPSA